MPDLEMQNNGMERTPYVNSETLRVRCPHCRKLYMVQFSDIHEAKPRFECVQCHSRFWLSLPDTDLSREVDGLPVEVKQPPAQPSRPKAAPMTAPRDLEPCPKCFKPVEVGISECTHCGVMISKFKSGLSFTEPVPAHSTALQAAWKKVISDYANLSLHQEFLRMAQREYNLAYAAAQYGQMLKLMPTDEITRQRISEIHAMSSVMLPPRRASHASRTSRGSTARIYGYPRLWQIPLLGATILMVAGLAVPFLRNLVGVGAAFLFLAVAMHVHFRR